MVLELAEAAKSIPRVEPYRPRFNRQMSTGTASNQLGVSRQTLQRLFGDKLIPGHMDGRGKGGTLYLDSDFIFALKEVLGASGETMKTREFANLLGIGNTTAQRIFDLGLVHGFRHGRTRFYDRPSAIAFSKTWNPKLLRGLDQENVSQDIAEQLLHVPSAMIDRLVRIKKLQRVDALISLSSITALRTEWNMKGDAPLTTKGVSRRLQIGDTTTKQMMDQGIVPNCYRLPNEHLELVERRTDPSNVDALRQQWGMENHTVVLGLEDARRLLNLSPAQNVLKFMKPAKDRPTLREHTPPIKVSNYAMHRINDSDIWQFMMIRDDVHVRMVRVTSRPPADKTRLSEDEEQRRMMLYAENEDELREYIEKQLSSIVLILVDPEEYSEEQHAALQHEVQAQYMAADFPPPSMPTPEQVRALDAEDPYDVEPNASPGL